MRVKIKVAKTKKKQPIGTEKQYEKDPESKGRFQH